MPAVEVQVLPPQGECLAAAQASGLMALSVALLAFDSLPAQRITRVLTARVP